MTFFHDLNKRLSQLVAKQDLHESKVAESEKWIQKAVNPEHKGDLHKALHVAQGEKIPKAKIEKATHSKNPKLRHMAQFAKNVANEEVADEGNAFTAKLKATPKGEKFKLGDKTFKDTSEIEEGFKEMDAWLAQREKEKGTGKFDKSERTLPGGMKATTYTRRHDDEEDSDDEVKSDAPKRRGRPKGKAKGPERVTAKSYKYKAGRPAKKEKTEEDLDTDGVMMTRPTNCSSESAADDSAIKSAIKLLKKNGYNVDKKEEVDEKAVSKAQQKFMGMVHAAQKGEKPASKEVAKVAKEMPKKAAKDFASTKHKGLPTHVEEEGKPDFLDLDKDGNKAEPMKQAAKQAKEKKVDETTVAGSVAPVQNAAPKGKGGMQFGKGVYESLDQQFKQALTESVQVQVAEHALDGDEESITITATGADVHRLKELLKLAGMDQQDQGCGCGQTPCGCSELDENSPDWPTNTEKLDAEPNLRTYSGGLNGPKSTGQTTVPVVASQLRRQASMEESVKLEKTLSDLYKNYKG
jgi:hypothetical protein